MTDPVRPRIAQRVFTVWRYEKGPMAPPGSGGDHLLSRIPQKLAIFVGDERIVTPVITWAMYRGHREASAISTAAAVDAGGSTSSRWCLTEWI